jgi:hypothetical protein
MSFFRKYMRAFSPSLHARGYGMDWLCGGHLIKQALKKTPLAIGHIGEISAYSPQ